jgi:hypothetical protein
MCHRPGNYQQIVVKAKQSAYMPDGTNLQIRGVGVRRGSNWQEIDGGTGVSTKHARLTQKKIQPANLL